LLHHKCILVAFLDELIDQGLGQVNMIQLKGMRGVIKVGLLFQLLDVIDIVRFGFADLLIALHILKEFGTQHPDSSGHCIILQITFRLYQDLLFVF